MLTIGQAAHCLGVSVDTLRNWDESGKLTAIKADNGHRFYELEQINPLKQNMAAKEGVKLWQEFINQSFDWVFGVGVEIINIDDKNSDVK